MSVTDTLLAFPRSVKSIVAISADIISCCIAVWLAFSLRFDEIYLEFDAMIVAAVVSVSLAVPVFGRMGLYRAIFRYSGMPVLLRMVTSLIFYGALYALIFSIIGVFEIPRSVGLLQPLILGFLIGSSRLIVRVWLGSRYQSTPTTWGRTNVLVYGAGTAGRQIVSALAYSNVTNVVGYIDDDDALFGRVLNGLPVFNIQQLHDVVSRNKVTEVLLAIPSAEQSTRNRILRQLQPEKVVVRTLPAMQDIVSGKVTVADVQDLKIEDLLGRDPVKPDNELLAINVHKKTVMVTGAGGSIGSEICRQILAIGPSKLILVDHSEYALYTIHQNLMQKLSDQDTLVVPVLASIRDIQLISRIMSTWKPDTIYHAAAYKHVPLVEYNVVEGVKNNVLGTMCIASTAVEAGVSNFVLISTDKAVRPTNMMGASKRLSEMILQAMSSRSGNTNFCIVRFGNVLNSSGSVVPKFRSQILAGGPITLTHAEVTRFFMTVEEASQLVIQSGAMAKGGDIFLLDMGDPVRIFDLARRMIELSGLTVQDEENPNGDIRIEVTGLRRGEKLYEELLIGDKSEPTSHSRVMKANEDFLHWDKLKTELEDLERGLENNDLEIIYSQIEKLVTGYRKKNQITDELYSRGDTLIRSPKL